MAYPEDHNGVPNVKRWVITNMTRKDGGVRVHTFARQGKNTYATKEEAEEKMRLFEPDLRSRIHGDIADTLEVREVWCWPGHFDPCNFWLD